MVVVPRQALCPRPPAGRGFLFLEQERNRVYEANSYDRGGPARGRARPRGWLAAIEPAAWRHQFSGAARRLGNCAGGGRERDRSGSARRERGGAGKRGGDRGAGGERDAGTGRRGTAQPAYRGGDAGEGADSL